MEMATLTSFKCNIRVSDKKVDLLADVAPLIDKTKWHVDSFNQPALTIGISLRPCAFDKALKHTKDLIKTLQKAGCTLDAD